MDIIAIEQAIEELEQSATTVSNIKELASLYIVKERLENSTGVNPDTSADNLTAVTLPVYCNHINVKYKFQKHLIPEHVVINSLKSTCDEIYSLISNLYFTTDSEAERNEINLMINNLSKLNY